MQQLRSEQCEERSRERDIETKRLRITDRLPRERTQNCPAVPTHEPANPVAGTDGLTVGRTLEKTGWLSSDTAELVFTNCWVPEENLLGEEHRGFHQVMHNFQNERLVLSAMAVGSSQAAIDATVTWTKSRQAFGTALYDKDVIRQRLAMLQARLDAARLSLYQAAWLVEQDHASSVQAVSSVKALAGELANEVMYAAVQFHGGLGYMRESAVERMARDARCSQSRAAPPR